MDEDGPQDGDAGINTLKINEKFAQRHEYNERRKILEKNKDRIYEASESSSSSEEDSDAELLNPTVEKKFLQLVEAIRRNDPQLKQSDKPLFDDDDFNDSKAKKNSDKRKAMTLKDQIRKHTLKKMDKGSDDSNSDSEDGSNSSRQDEFYKASN